MSPRDFEDSALLGEYLRQIFEMRFSGWLLEVVADRPRSAAYMQAVQRAVAATPQEAEVLTLGSAGALSAMTAARAGARRVTICEPRRYAAQLAREVVRANGLSDRVAVVSKPAEQLAVGSELAAPADLVILESIDPSLLGWRLAPSLNHALRHLTKPQARTVPAAARVWAMGVELRSGRVCGFDLSLYDELRRGAAAEYIDLRETPYLALTLPAEVFTFDFTRAIEPAERTVTLAAVGAGTVNAVVFWMDLHFEGGSGYSTGPQNPALRAYTQLLWYIDPRPVEGGTELLITFRHDTLTIDVEGARLCRGGTSLPDWQLSMVSDRQRNRAFEAALERAVKPGDEVLDIGTGTGILALLAARAGAGRVIACESLRHLAELAQRIVAHNGLGERISVHNVRSVNLVLERKADVIVSEIVDYGLLGEEILLTLTHARKAFAQPGARIIPQKATVWGQGISICSPDDYGFDLTPLEAVRWSRGYRGVRIDQIEHRQLTEIFKVCDFDFRTATPAGFLREIGIRATAAGTLNAVVYWFTLHLDEQVSLSTAPGSGLHWRQALRYLPKPYAVRPADPLTLLATVGDREIAFELHRHKSGQLEARPWPEPAEPIPEPAHLRATEELDREISRRIRAQELPPERLLELLDDLARHAPASDLDAVMVTDIRRLISNSIAHPWSPLYYARKS